MSTVDEESFNGSCGATADGCVCMFDGHIDAIPHRCLTHHVAGRRCGARWRGTWGTDTFEPVTYPGGEPA